MSSRAMQRYAAEIYRIQEDQDTVPITEVAEHVDVSMQAASRMVRRLKDQGYIRHVPYRGVRLTESGLKLALKGVRRHRLAELYLVRQMGFGWDEVHSITDTFERGITQAIEDRIDQLMGHPTRCPHGEPIPAPDGSLPTLNDRPLTDLPQGMEAVISRVRVHDPEKLRYFGGLGLVPGARIRFLTCAPFEGPVRIMVGKTDQVIGYRMAGTLWVEPVE
jgi:DtxR family Mn-dependent transcriptional regulator